MAGYGVLGSASLLFASELAVIVALLLFLFNDCMVMGLGYDMTHDYDTVYCP